ncbi:hypothetical protein CASFOL_027439 [Castilleja foliolosa]|uniref:Uncharacterized protein n=1 Tax=Castilleja foliolosa TaxID=1961234 RepID=A0ABD3CET6_9LAMI
MALLSHKLKHMLKKKLISFKSGNHHGYKRLDDQLEIDEKKGFSCAPKGSCVPIYVGQYKPQILYRVRTDAFNSPAVAALLDDYRDDISDHCCGPISVPCSVIDFERALGCIILEIEDNDHLYYTT